LLHLVLGDANDTTNSTKQETEPAVFMPTPIPDEVPKTKDKNKMKDLKGPLVLNPDFSTKMPEVLEPINSAVPPTPFTPPKTKTKEQFLGPYAPNFEGTPFQFQGKPKEHGFLGPVQNQPPPPGGKPPPQRGSPSQHMDHIDPQFLEDLIRGSLQPGTAPRRPPPQGHLDSQQDSQRQTISGRIPQQVLQGNHFNSRPQGASIPIDASGRPILSPIAAHIEQHFHNHPGHQGRPQGQILQGRPPPLHPGNFNEPPQDDYEEHFLLQNGQLVPFNPANFHPNTQNPNSRAPPLPQQFGEHVLIARNDTQFNDPDLLSSNTHEKTTNKGVCRLNYS
jgi:hypothetical protein